MRLHDQWDIVVALPYLAMGIGLAWLAVTLIVRHSTRLHRDRRQKREEALRRAVGPAPWNDWLRAINERSQRDRLDIAQDRPRGKWRE